jgi:hypothetical protein
MKNRALLFYFFSILVFAGCSFKTPSSNEIHNGTTETIPTKIKLLPMPTGTLAIPSITFTRTPTPAPTWTPLSTLPANEALAIVNDLLVNNGGCNLPCWWGITPGETSWQEAHQFLATIATKIEQGGSGLHVENGVTYQTTNYSVTYDIAGVPSGGGALFSIKNGIISSIYVGPASTVQSFKLHQLLTDFGKPEKVLLKTYPNTPELYLPFRLVLFYANHRILAFYEYEAHKEGDLLQGCPLSVGPELWLWSTNEVWTEKDAEEIVLGPDSPNPLRPLEEVTDMSIDDFFQAFKNPESKTCIETPMDLW